MSIQTFIYTTPLDTLLDHNTFTRARLKANPLTAGLAAPFDAFQTDWTAIRAAETQLHIELVEANAAIAGADEELDVLVDAVSNAVLLITQGNRGAQLYVQYFGAKRPSELRKPVLGAELETMRKWVPSLKASTDANLSSLGDKVEKAVATADDAVQKRAAAEQKIHDFKTIGARKALVDQSNAIRKAAYGKLAEMPHANPALHLPKDFAEPFFLHDTGKNAKALTSADVAAKIAGVEAELGALREQLAAVKAQEQAEARAKSQAEADKQALDAAKKAAAEAAARVAELEAKLAQNK
jgi:hypothetical protein